MISSIFFLNHHGDVIIEKQFRGKFSRTILEDFWSSFMRPLRSVDEAPAVILYNSFVFVQIHCSDVILLAVTANEGFPLFVMEILSLIARVAQRYLVSLSETTLRDNFSVVYQLLEEVIHNGYPLTTEMHVLEKLVAPQTLQNKLRTALDVLPKAKNRPFGIRSVPWRDSSTKHPLSEIFLDVVEQLDCVIDCEGNYVRSSVRGVVDVNSRLNGMPDIILRLANTDIINDVAFHRCVRRHRYSADRTINFIPPDGKFTLLQYTCKPLVNVRAPFYITPQVTFDKLCGRFNCMIGIHGSGLGMKKRDCEIHKVVVHLSFPPQTEAVQVHNSTQGTTSFNKSRSVLTWNIGSLYRSTNSLSGEFTVALDGSEMVVPCTGESATVEFTIPNHLLSSIRVDSLQVLNEIGKPYKGVKYMTHAGRFVVRTV